MKDHFSLKMFALAFDDLCNASYNPRKEVIKEGGCECGVCALVLVCLFVPARVSVWRQLLQSVCDSKK